MREMPIDDAEEGAQRLVSESERSNGLLHQQGIERTGELEGDRHVGRGRAGIDLRQRPVAALLQAGGNDEGLFAAPAAAGFASTAEWLADCGSRRSRLVKPDPGARDGGLVSSLGSTFSANCARTSAHGISCAVTGRLRMARPAYWRYPLDRLHLAKTVPGYCLNSMRRWARLCESPPVSASRFRQLPLRYFCSGITALPSAGYRPAWLAW